jgi:hypothetical protein
MTPVLQPDGSFKYVDSGSSGVAVQDAHASISAKPATKVSGTPSSTKLQSGNAFQQLLNVNQQSNNAAQSGNLNNAKAGSGLGFDTAAPLSTRPKTNALTGNNAGGQGATSGTWPVGTLVESGGSAADHTRGPGRPIAPIAKINSLEKPIVNGPTPAIDTSRRQAVHTPSVDAPKTKAIIRAPSVSALQPHTPTLHTPSIKTPPAHIPRVHTPTITVRTPTPHVRTPTIRVPTVRVPTVRTPTVRVTVPTIRVPSIR